MSKRMKCVFVWILVVMLLPFGSGIPVRAEEAEPERKVFTDESGSYEITLTQTDAWENGYNVEATVKNTGESKLENWLIRGRVDDPIEKVWNAQYKQDDSQLEISYETYNRCIEAGEQITFGMQASGKAFAEWDEFSLSQQTRTAAGECTVSYEIKSSWDKKAIVEATVKNDGEQMVRGWKVVFSLAGEMDSIWNGEILAQEGRQYVVGSKTYNADIAPQDSVRFGFQVTYEESGAALPEGTSIYAVTDPVKETTQETIDWYKSLTKAEASAVTSARDAAKDPVKVALLDSGVDYTTTIQVEERVDFVEPATEEENPLWDDLSGHGTGVAGMIVSDPSVSDEEEDSTEDAGTEETEETDFSFLTNNDVVEPVEVEEAIDDTDEIVDEEEEGDEGTEQETESDSEDEDDAGEAAEETEEAAEETEEAEETETAEEQQDASIYAVNEDYGEIEGLNKKVSLTSVRVLDEKNEAPVSRVIQGIRWAIDHDMNILHISWGCHEDNSELHQIIKEAYQKGMLLVAPAGNEGSVCYPAAYEEVIAVNSVDSEGNRAAASASGEAVELCAPGENVTVYTSLGALTRESGSSFAAPQVTALAALLWQQDSSRSNEFIRQLMDATATALGDRQEYGYGMINWERAVDDYGQFAASYSEKRAVEENEAQQLLEADAQPASEEVLTVVEETKVEGLWAKHGKIVKDENGEGNRVSTRTSNIKAGLNWPDEANSQIKGKSGHPLFHGGSSYVAAYVHIMEKAKNYWNTGKWEWDTEDSDYGELEKELNESLGHRFIGTNGTICDFKSTAETLQAEINAGSVVRMNEDTNNETIRAVVARFVMGMALHTLGDTFSHKSYGLKDKIKYYEDMKNPYPNTYSNIMHGPKRSQIPKNNTIAPKVLVNAKKSKYFDNRADCATIVPQRYRYTAQLYKEIIDHKVNQSRKQKKMPSGRDFICCKPKKVTTGAKQDKRFKSLSNHFGIKGLASQVKKQLKKEDSKLTKRDKTALKNLDLKQVIKQFDNWKLFQIDIPKEISVKEIQVYKLKKEGMAGKKVDQVDYYNESDKKPDVRYFFLGDVETEYVISVIGEKGDTPCYATVYTKKTKKVKSRKIKRYITVHHSTSGAEYNTGAIKVIPECEEHTLYGKCNVKIASKYFEAMAAFKGKVTGVKSVKNGHVSDTVPLENAKVTLVNAASKSIKKEVETDKNGRYEFKGKDRVPPGVYKIKVQRKGYKTETGRIVVYSKDKKKNCYDIQLEPSEKSGKGGAAGSITDAQTGKKVGGLSLQLMEGFGEKNGTVVATAEVDANGNYRIADLPSGYYTAQIVDNREVAESRRYRTGSMNVRVLGNEVLTGQNGVVTNTLDENQLRIVLTWGKTPNDLDSHLLGCTSDGKSAHMSYKNKTIKNSSGVIEFMLDVDDTSSYGPETTTIYHPTDDDYNFYVHNFTHKSDTELQNSGAVVQVYKGSSNLPWQTFYVPEQEGYYWNVFSYDAENEILTPYEEVTYTEPE